jgi:hypothetical protein
MSEFENILSVDWDIPYKAYIPKFITLPSGDKMVVREVTRSEIPIVLEVVRPLLTVERDFYDIVSARVYAELLGCLRYRVRNEFVLVGLIDGEIAGIANNRAISQKKWMSYHTLAIKRGMRAGAHMFAAKQDHSFNLGAEIIYVTAESPIGFRRWMIEWGLEKKEGIQHELGGADTWAITREIYDRVKDSKVFGQRPVSEDLLNRNKVIKKTIPDVLK